MDMMKKTGGNPVALYDAGAVATEGSLAQFDANGKIVNVAAADTAKAVGMITAIDSDNKVRVEEGVYRLPNATANALTRKDRGKACYVAANGAVAGTGTSKAGIVIDVDTDGVWVAVGAIYNA